MLCIWIERTFFTMIDSVSGVFIIWNLIAFLILIPLYSRLLRNLLLLVVFRWDLISWEWNKVTFPDKLIMNKISQSNFWIAVLCSLFDVFLTLAFSHQSMSNHRMCVVHKNGVIRIFSRIYVGWKNSDYNSVNLTLISQRIRVLNLFIYVRT